MTLIVTRLSPQARKHCWNGGVGTDGNWDSKENGKKRKIKETGGEAKGNKKMLKNPEKSNY